MPEVPDSIKYPSNPAIFTYAQVPFLTYYDSLAWTGPSTQIWDWYLPDDGFTWCLLDFSGTSNYASWEIFEFSIDGVLLYKQERMYKCEWHVGREHMIVVQAGAHIQVKATNIYAVNKEVAWTLDFWRAPK